MQSYKIIIGRSNDCDLVLADMTVSRRHAEIEMIDGNRLLLTDCQSTQGTYLIHGGSEQKIKQQIITKHDILRFGNIKIPVREVLSATHFPEPIEFEADALSDQPPPHNYNQQPNGTLQVKDTMTFLELYFSFKGRISRSTYLQKGILPWLLLSIISYYIILVHLNVDADSEMTLIGVLNLIFLIPSLSINVKRCHDRNRSGWFQLILLIPVIGGLWFLIEMWFIKGTDGVNKYGQDPLK